MHLFKNSSKEKKMKKTYLENKKKDNFLNEKNTPIIGKIIRNILFLLLIVDKLFYFNRDTSNSISR